MTKPRCRTENKNQWSKRKIGRTKFRRWL